MQKKDYDGNGYEIDYSLSRQGLIEAIEEARKELQQCSEYFELVDEPILIDYAIYKEAAAKARYVFLLAEARKLNIKIDKLTVQTYEKKAN